MERDHESDEDKKSRIKEVWRIHRQRERGRWRDV